MREKIQTFSIERSTSPHNAWIAALLFAIATATACTPTRSNGNFTIALPDLNQLAQHSEMRKASDVQAQSLVLGRIVINVTGPEIATPIRYLWSNEDGESPAPPSTISLTVPGGKSRLVQVLAVVKDSAGADDSESIFYGDATTNVSGETAVEIPLAAQTSISGAEGSILGRYLNADGTGPTGSVAVQFSVAGKPPLTVDRASMIGGWFRFFAHENLNLTYVLESTGAKIFDSVNLNSESLLSQDEPTTTGFDERMRTVRITVPASYRLEYNGSTSTRRAQKKKKSIIGFWGPGAGSRWVCYPSLDFDFENLYVSATTTDPNHIGWLGTGTPTATSGGVENVTGIGRGGVASSNTTRCASPSADENTNRLTVLFSPGGGPGVPHYSGDGSHLGHVDGFKFLTVISDYYMSTYLMQTTPLRISGGSASTTLSWEYAPGIVPEGSRPGIAGTAIFARERAVAASDYRDTIECSKLAARGFTQIGSVAAVSDLRAQSYQVNGVDAGKYRDGRLEFAACPYVMASGVPQLLSGGILHQTSNSTSNGLNLKITRVDSSAASVQVAGECVGYRLTSRGYDDSDIPVAVATSVDLTTYDNLGLLYSDSTCSGSPATPVANSSGRYVQATFNYLSGAFQSPVFYVKSTTARHITFTLESNRQLATTGASILVRPTTEATQYLLTANGSNGTALVTGSCSQAVLTLADSSATSSTVTNIPAGRSLPQTFTLTGGGYQYYSDFRCSMPLAMPMTIPANVMSKTLYLKPLSAGANQSVTVTRVTSDSPTMNSLGTFTADVDDPIVHHFSATAGYQGNNEILSGVCTPFYTNAFTVGGASIYDQNYSLQLTVTGGTLYTSSDCTTAANLSAVNRRGYFIKLAPSSSEVVVAGSDGNGHALPSTTFSVLAPRKFEYRRTNYSPITTATKNFCQEIVVHAQRADSGPFYAYNYYAPGSSTPLAPTFQYQFTSAGGSIQVYSDAACSNPVAGNIVSFVSPGDSSPLTKTVYIKHLTGSGPSVGLVASFVNAPTISWSQSLNWIDLDHIGLSFTGSGGTGSLKVGAYDSSNNLVTLSDPIPVSLTIVGNFLFGGTATTTATITAETSFTNIGVNGGSSVSNVIGSSITPQWFNGDVTKVTGGTGVLTP